MPVTPTAFQGDRAKNPTPERGEIPPAGNPFESTRTEKELAR